MADPFSALEPEWSAEQRNERNDPLPFRSFRFSADFCHLSVSVLAVAVTWLPPRQVGTGSGVPTRSTLQGQMVTDDGIVTKILHTSLDYHSPLLHDVASASQGEGQIQILFD